MTGSFPFNDSDAVLMAVSEADSRGGIDGEPVEVLPEFTGGDLTVAARLAAQLVDAEADAIVGLGFSSLAETVIEVSGPAQVPTLSYAASSPSLTGTEPPLDYFFRTIPSDVLQARVLIQEIPTRWACTRVATIYVADAYGEGLNAAFTSQYTNGGGVVTHTQPIDEDAQDYGDALTAVATSDPDCIVLVAFTDTAGRIFRQWPGVSPRPDVTWIGSDGLFEDTLVTEAVDPALIDGVVGTAPRFESNTPEFVDFERRYEATYGRPPAFGEHQLYDATALVLLGLAKVGPGDRSALRDALFDVSRPPGEAVGPGELARGLDILARGGEVNYVGASGPVDFDDAGDVVTDYVVWRYAASVQDFVLDAVIPVDDVIRVDER